MSRHVGDRLLCEAVGLEEAAGGLMHHRDLPNRGRYEERIPASSSRIERGTAWLLDYWLTLSEKVI